MWKFNDIEEQQLLDTINKLDKTLLIDRIAYMLNMSPKVLLSYYTEEFITNLTANMLINRNVNTDIINNPQDFFTDPYKLHNAVEAAELICKYAKDKNAIIYIFADFDADGITAGYITFKALSDVVDCQLNVYFPERKEGYGLSMDFCKQVVDKKDEYSKVLVMTVDNGISKVEETDYLKANGIEVLITDHHTSKDAVPNCLIVDPHNNTVEQSDEFKHLCGCGVAFKVLFIVQDMLGKNNMYEYIPYLTISTISDIMPLEKENLAIIQYGLNIMNSDECPNSIKLLTKANDIDIITSETIGWVIAPIINACGRLNDTKLAADFFFLQDDVVIEDIITLMIATNEKRKSITKRYKKKLQNYNTDDFLFVLNDEKVEAGILGILAGEATKQFNKPAMAVVVNPEKPDQLKGSARSIPQVNLIPILQELKDEGIIDDFGGHPEAAGVFFKEENIQAIKDKFNQIKPSETILSMPKTEEDITIDSFVDLDDLNTMLIAISNIIPTDGKDLSLPTFGIMDLNLKNYKAYPSGYLEITVQQNGVTLDMSCFNLVDKLLTEILPELDKKDDRKIHIVGTITKHFRTKKYTLNVKDIMVA